MIALLMLQEKQGVRDLKGGTKGGIAKDERIYPVSLCLADRITFDLAQRQTGLLEKG